VVSDSECVLAAVEDQRHNQISSSSRCRIKPLISTHGLRVIIAAAGERVATADKARNSALAVSAVSAMSS